MKMYRRWKKTAVILSLTILLGTSDTAFEPAVAFASTTQQQIDKTKEEMNQLENQLDKTHDNLNQLENQKNSLEKELDSLNSQLMAVTENLESLEHQIRDKEQEITETQEALEQARETEEWQYNSMVAMVRCMYEMQEDTYLSALLSSGSLADLLNKADNIERMVSYSQKKMREYQENRMLIEEQEALLQSERLELENLHSQAEEEKSKVNDLISEMSKTIKRYAGDIAEAERKAEAYEAELRKKEADLETLKKKLAEELAMSRAAANGVWRDISEINFEENDRYLLANLIYCEAGNQPYEGQVAVGSVVINRVLSSQFPDTVTGVIYQNRQFSPVASGRLALALDTNRATEACYRAADEAMAGVTTVGNCVFFRTPIPGLTGISIGGHIFY